jgi:hypothetical protein
MNASSEAAQAKLHWRDLPDPVRDALAAKIENLYGGASAEQAFDSIPPDKQHALLLFWRRLSALDLWRAVRKIENVWGTGGVGMDFAAYPFLATALISARAHKKRRFTKFLARHKHTTAGFYERSRHVAILHFLYADDARGDVNARKWSVHFDYNSPVGSLSSAWHHLKREFFGGFTPNERDIRAAFRFEPPLS